MNRPALLLGALLVAACARDGRATVDGGASERWRGDVSFPGLPHIGVVVEVGEGSTRMIAAPNMGFGSAELVRFTPRAPPGGRNPPLDAEAPLGWWVSPAWGAQPATRRRGAIRMAGFTRLAGATRHSTPGRHPDGGFYPSIPS